MTRREFSLAVTGVLAYPRLGVLEAIGTNQEWSGPVWELRSYRGAAPMLARVFAAVFPRAGIHPISQESAGAELSYLIPFEDLAAREHAWTMLNADPAWIAARPGFRSYQFSLFRLLEPSV
jgi:hypothetical protein